MATRDKSGRAHYKFSQDQYNLILTNNAFMDKTMAGWFWESDRRLSEARAYVAEVLNCEDILMNCKLGKKMSLTAHEHADTLICLLKTSSREGLAFHQSWHTSPVTSSQSMRLEVSPRDPGTQDIVHVASRSFTACSETYSALRVRP